jgi:DNA polymerase V
MGIQMRNPALFSGTRKLVGIADGKSYYCYYHIFARPDLAGKPVVVLSNNDGMVIALNDEAKSIGLERGSIWYKVPLHIQEQCAVFSSTYREYLAHMWRVNTIFADLVPSFEVYSIDEGWFDASGIPNLRQFVRDLMARIYQLTGIVLRIGIAPTKSLAKIAQRIAKTSPEGFCILETEEEIAAALRDYPVSEMWNVGAAYSLKLQQHGVLTAGRLRIMPEWWVKKHMTIQGVRLLHELWGESCLPIEEFIDPKKNIGVGQSFSKPTNDEQELLAAANYYSEILSGKLRTAKMVSSVFIISLRTNKHKPEQVQHNPSRIVNLKAGISNLVDISAMVRKAVVMMRKEVKGALYMKIELFAAKLIPENETQIVMGSENNTAGKNRLTTAMEDLNQRWGKGTVCYANTLTAYQRNLYDEDRVSEAYIRRINYPSPNYTTSWKESFIAC